MSANANAKAKAKIAKLEELLSRVQQRAAEARPAAHAAPSGLSPKATTGLMPASAPASGAATPATPHVSEPPPAAWLSAPPPTESVAPSRPSTVPPITTVDAGSDGEVDVEVSTEVVDIDVDVDLDETGMPLESGAQPIAEHASLADDASFAESAMAEPDVPALEPLPEEPEPEAAPAPALANEIEEPAPSSSPRPIASEKPDTFEEESAPRHTPPPESGKQVAAAPSSPPARKPSAPPPSLEGHTLIGGWREPGLGGPPAGQPGAGAPTGVRVPGPGAHPPATAHGPGSPLGSMPAEPITATRASVPPRTGERPLTADVTKADLRGAGAKVAAFEGTAPAFKPSTFGELLDASLAL